MSAWEQALSRLEAGAVLLSVWGEGAHVHLAWREGGSLRHLAREAVDREYPAVSARMPQAIRLERALRDEGVLTPRGLPDSRPWLKHDACGEPYPFLAVEGEGLHQIPVGPVHAGIIEPGHFRFTCDGETVVRLEARLGYVHRDVAGLMRGADIEVAAKLAGRISGDSTVAYAWAFARAIETALAITPPARALHLRAVMAELERVANHLGDIGAICNDGGFPLMQAHCAVLRERVLRAAGSCFGHRLMMDCIVPGGVGADLNDEKIRTLTALIGEIAARFPGLVRLYDLTASLQDRTNGTGCLSPALARRFGAGGVVGRASGHDFDARRDVCYAPYDGASFAVPVLSAGDVNARIWLRIKEIEQSLGLLSHFLTTIPIGATRCEIPPQDGEGMALVEGFRGDIFLWLALEEGKIRHCHVRDPSWFQWPLLEAAIEGNIVADFPLCNKSFNCSYAGHDG